MARYIDADALLEELDLIEMNTQVSIKQGDKNYKLCQKGILSGLNWCRNIIYEVPTADVVEVKHGEWIDNEDDYWIKCSVCEFEYFDEQGDMFNNYGYCPHCGAKMDKGVTE